jgi:hypothetical protein
MKLHVEGARIWSGIFRFVRRTVLPVGFLFLCLTRLLEGQSIPVEIERAGDSVRVSWAEGLGLVQPQRLNTLDALNWLDFGTPTAASSMVYDTISPVGFVRLRFLPPSISVHPRGQTNPAGSSVTLEVSASGTFPLTYQWYKDKLPLAGKTNSQLPLSGLTASNAGNYYVFITNRAGRVVSQEALVTVIGAQKTPAGIYMGKFAGQSDSGGFAIMVRPEGLAYAVGYNTPQEEGVFIQSFKVALDGGFNAVTVQKGKALGNITETGISGTFVNSTGGSGSFRGDRKSDSGLHSKSAGYYVGTYDGAFAGSAYAILAADGSLFFYSIDDPTSPTADGDGGGFGIVDASNVLFGATVPNGLKLTGTLNAATSVLTGSYGMGDITLGTFRVARTATPQ